MSSCNATSAPNSHSTTNPTGEPALRCRPSELARDPSIHYDHDLRATHPPNSEPPAPERYRKRCYHTREHYISNADAPSLIPRCILLSAASEEEEERIKIVVSIFREA